MELCKGNLVGGLHYWGPWKICRKGSGDGHFHRGPAGEPGRGLVYRGRRKMKVGSRNGVTLSEEAP